MQEPGILAEFVELMLLLELGYVVQEVYVKMPKLKATKVGDILTPPSTCRRANV